MIDIVNFVEPFLRYLGLADIMNSFVSPVVFPEYGQFLMKRYISHL